MAVKARGVKKFLLLSTMLAGLLLCVPRNLPCRDDGFKYIENYTPEDYNSRAQNWSIVQDKRGIIYIGNIEGLLEYDGVSWRFITIPNNTVRSLAVDESGAVYVGGKDEIGFLAPDKKGTLQYVSLSARLCEKQPASFRARRIHATDEGVYFRTSKYMFRWHRNELTKVSPEPGKTFNASFLCGGKLYVRKRGIGLEQVTGNKAVPVPAGGTFADSGIFMMVPFDSPSMMLIGTSDGRFYKYDGVKAVPFQTEADEYIKKNKLYHGIRLKSGDFALATTRGGLVIIDPDGHLKYIFNEASGLQDNDVKYVFEDTGRNLWLALGYGVSKIEYSSPISTYDKRSGLAGLVLSVTRHGPDNLLYAGTTQGLYSLVKEENKTAAFALPGKFRPVPGIPGHCTFLLSVGNSLLAATSKGVFDIGEKKSIIEKRSYVLLCSRKDRRRIWVGTEKSLVSLYLKNGKWAGEYKFEDINTEIRSIVEDQKGNLWLGTLTKGVIYTDFATAGAMTRPGVKHYDSSRGLPGGETHVYMAAGHVMFATQKGIYRFDETAKTFSPDSTLGAEFAGGAQGKSVFRIAEDRDKNIWLHSLLRNIQAEHKPDGTFVLTKEPFLRMPRTQVNAIFPDPDGKMIWFATNNGLICCDKRLNEIKKYNLDFHTLIRKVDINGELKFNGYIARRPELEYPFQVIDFKDRNLRFEFAAPFFEAETGMQYRCRLEGYEDDWAAWTAEPFKEYTNLGPGNYTFLVQARNVFEYGGRAALFRFRVLPPWYRTWWAFSLYVLMFFLLLFFIVKWRSGNLEREKRRLERIVKERTKEIEERKKEVEEKNEQLQEQTEQLAEQSEKLKEMDKVKSRFFTNISHEFRTPLTLIMGPIEQMIAEGRERAQQRRLNLMLRNSQRLLQLINDLLDIAKFEIGKAKLKAGKHNIIPFLKGIAANFDPEAEKNEQELLFLAEEDDIQVYFDPEKLERAIFNLLFNAVKFTPPGGRITLSAARHASQEEEKFPSGSLEISVKDTGPGIAREHLQHIFDRFYQSDSTYEQHRYGTGIGLSIAQEIAELHRGTLNVHSIEGEGTEFIIRLPLGDGHLGPDEKVDGGEVSPPPAPSLLPPAEIVHGEQPGEGIGDAVQPEKDIILVVEDSADLQEYIREALEPLYQVVDARDGQEGILKAREKNPALIISDIMMPEIDGYELCRRLKDDINTSHIPIILLTAKVSEEQIVEGLEIGADDYVTKPFSIQVLLARIKNRIELRRQLQERLKHKVTEPPRRKDVSKKDREFLEKLHRVIEKNMSDTDFNVDMLCERMGMKQPTLYRKISAIFGISPTEYLRSYRLERSAKRLREDRDISILDVTLEVGFDSTSYFGKCFKKKYGMSPSDYQAGGWKEQHLNGNYQVE